VGILDAVAAVASSPVAILVGFRLLRLGLTSRRIPELVMGGALLSIDVVGFPLACVSLGLFGYNVFAWGAGTVTAPGDSGLRARR
jgi:hypothetical protein